MSKLLVLSDPLMGNTEQQHLTRFILWRVEPLLCNDRKMGSCTETVSGQWLGNHIRAATNRRAKMDVLFETEWLCVVRAEFL
jgi:hypothetical protein